MAIRLINAEEVRRLLPVADCIPLMREAFLAEQDEYTRQPIRRTVAAHNGRGVLGWMPGYLACPQWLGVKVVSVFPGNFGSELGSHQGMVLLFEAEQGAPVAILDGREITAIRTAAATAAATDVLAPKNAKTVAIFGYGEQARTHLEALLKVRDFTSVIVWGRNAETAARFAREESDRHGRAVEVAESAEQAASTADVICTVTAAAEPFLKGEWLKAGQHLNVVGSSVPATAEVDSEVLVRSRIFVDFKESALELGGDIRRAISSGVITQADILGSLGEVLSGRIQGRRDATDITFFKSLGMIAQDLIACDAVLRRAELEGVGSVLKW